MAILKKIITSNFQAVLVYPNTLIEKHIIIDHSSKECSFVPPIFLRMSALPPGKSLLIPPKNSFLKLDINNSSEFGELIFLSKHLGMGCRKSTLPGYRLRGKQ